MADRTVVVRLKALTSGYERDMKSAASTTDRTKQSVTDFAERHQALGAAAVAGGAAVVAGLGAAAKAASDYEAELSKMVGLVGVSRDQVDKWSDELLRLGPEVGKSPKELAEAMFFVTSAGFEGAEAMEVLTASAKASAGGLGEVKSVAGAVVSAVNAYGSEVLSASEATDVLTATVREGQLEAQSLAPQLGRLLPLSSELGIEFHEVGGALAVLSRSSGDAAQSATNLRGIMSKLIKPSQQARDTLDEFGLSVGQVRSMVEEQGLLATLRFLEQTFGDNADAMSMVFEDVEALNGVLSILGQEATTVDGVFQGVQASVGAVDDAYAAYNETTRASLERLRATREAFTVGIGKNLEGQLAGAADAASGLMEAFLELPKPMQRIITLSTGAAGLGAALAGAAILAIPRIHDTITALRNMGVTATRVKGTLAGAGSIAANMFIFGQAAGHAADAIGGLLDLDMPNLEGLAKDLELLVKTGQVGGALGEMGGMKGIVEGIDRIADPSTEQGLRNTTNKFTTFVNEMVTFGALDLGSSTEELTRRLEGVDDVLTQMVQSGRGEQAADLFQKIADAAAEQGIEVEALARAFPNYKRELDLLAPPIEDAAIAVTELGIEVGDASGAATDSTGPMGDAAAGIEEVGDSAEDAKEDVNALSDELKAQTDPVFSVVDSYQGMAEAQQARADALRDEKDAAEDVEQAEEDLAKALRKHGRESEEARQAAEELEQAERRLVDTGRQVEGTSLDIARAVADFEAEASRGDITWRQFQSRLQDWVRDGRVTAQQARRIERDVKAAREEADRFKGTRRMRLVLRGLDKTQRDFGNLMHNVRQWDGSIFSADIVANLRGDVGNIVPEGLRLSTSHAGGPVSRLASDRRMPGLASDEVVRILQTGEHVLSRADVRSLRSTPSSTPTSTSIDRSSKMNVNEGAVQIVTSDSGSGVRHALRLMAKVGA